jgi:hypothetical protein
MPPVTVRVYFPLRGPSAARFGVRYSPELGK